MLKIVLHAIFFGFLTILTQIGGLAWLVAILFKQRLFVFLLAYSVTSAATVFIAPYFGRVALSCFETGPLQVQNWLYCALNRNYVSMELAEVLHDAANAVDQERPGTVTLVLDASFPYITGFPMLPHLSHDDGKKADLAFYYKSENQSLVGQTRSPIGYFAFEEGPTDCPDVWLTLRWDLAILQPLWPDYELDFVLTKLIIETLARDERVGKVLVEPHLTREMEISHPKVRFQGCRAARHDDHIHMQLH